MKPIKVESLDHAGVILTRLALRSRKTVVGMTPAVPLYGYCAKPPGDGILFRYWFPVSGEVSKVLLSAPGVTKDKPVDFQVQISGPIITNVLTHTLKRAEMVIEVNFPVNEGDRLIITTQDKDLSDIEVSALFRPKLSSGEQSQELIDGLLGAADEGIFLTDQPVPDGT